MQYLQSYLEARKLWNLKSFEEKQQEFIEELQKLSGAPVVLITNTTTPCPDLTFEFVSDYVLPSTFQKPSSAFCSGCECKYPDQSNVLDIHESCTGCDLKHPEKCQCLDDMINPKFAYDEEGLLLSKPGEIIFECNRQCSCGLKCPNRVVQRGSVLPIHLFYTGPKGWGVRSPRFIRKGTYVFSYFGEVITSEEALRREKFFEKENSTYLFDLDLIDDQCKYTVDARFYGNVSRFVNHSCDPNLAIFAVIQDRARTNVYKLSLFAIRDILPYEELCFDYSGWQGSSHKKNPLTGQKEHMIRNDCLCESSKCRKNVLSIAS